MVIEESKYDLLLAYIDTGANKDLPQEMIDYISILELIRGMHMRYENRRQLLNSCNSHPIRFHITRLHSAILKRSISFTWTMILKSRHGEIFMLRN